MKFKMKNLSAEVRPNTSEFKIDGLARAMGVTKIKTVTLEQEIKEILESEIISDLDFNKEEFKEYLAYSPSMRYLEKIKVIDMLNNNQLSINQVTMLLEVFEEEEKRFELLQKAYDGDEKAQAELMDRAAELKK